MKKLFTTLLFFVFQITTFSISVNGNTAEDSFGNKILLKKYERIVICDPSAVEIFYLIGGEDKIAGISRTKINKMYPEDKTEKLVSVGTITKPSIEKILQLNPDLVILNPMASKIEPLLKEYNIPYFIDRSVTFDEIFLKTKIYGILSGKEENAEKLIEEKKAKINEIKKDAAKRKDSLKGIILYTGNPMTSFGSDTIPAEIFKLLNIENPAEKFMGKSKILSAEMILEENPDIIIGTMKIKSVEELVKNNEFLKYSNAYKNGNIYVFESEKILRATPRIAEGIEEIYEVIKNVKK